MEGILIYLTSHNMPRGGLRPNAGRPVGRKNNATLEVEEARTILREMIFEQLEPIAKAQLDLATGLWYEDPEKGRVYKTRPDRAAAALLLAHSIGKPTETIQLEEDIVLNLDVPWNREAS